MTRSQIKRRFTSTRGRKGEYHAYFSVGCQSFRLATVDTRREAAFFREMIAAALENFLAITCGEGKL
jgi:hypothetical protein